MALSGGLLPALRECNCGCAQERHEIEVRRQGAELEKLKLDTQPKQQQGTALQP